MAVDFRGFITQFAAEWSSEPVRVLGAEFGRKRIAMLQEGLDGQSFGLGRPSRTNHGSSQHSPLQPTLRFEFQLNSPPYSPLVVGGTAMRSAWSVAVLPRSGLSIVRGQCRTGRTLPVMTSKPACHVKVP